MGINFCVTVQAARTSHAAWQQLAFCVLDAQHITPGPAVFDRHKRVYRGVDDSLLVLRTASNNR